jgi:hypothetical protein
VGCGHLSPWWRACTLSVQVEEALLASSAARDDWVRWTDEDSPSLSNAVGCVCAHLGG